MRACGGHVCVCLCGVCVQVKWLLCSVDNDDNYYSSSGWEYIESGEVGPSPSWLIFHDLQLDQSIFPHPISMFNPPPPQMLEQTLLNCRLGEVTKGLCN